MVAEFVSPTDPRWKGFLREAQHDFYHLPEYVTLAAEVEGGKPVCFYAESEDGKFLAPLVVKPIPASLGPSDQWVDACSPYGYTTPILVPPENAGALREFLGEFLQIARRTNLVSAFFRLHPLLPLPREPLSSHGMVVRHGQTIYVDLQTPWEALWGDFRKSCRSEIRRLQELGFVVEMDNWDYFVQFIALYHQTMIRQGADASYLFSGSYFSRLRAALGESLHLCSVLSPERELAAAGLFVSTGQICEYHLSASAPLHLKLAPSKSMLAFAIRWAQGFGHRVLHLGGGVRGRQDSLFAFKAGFSKLRSDFHTYRVIINPEKYNHLVRAWKRQVVDTTGGTDFFPEYRRPL